MSKEIVIQASKKETRIAILEDGKLAELYVENPDNTRTIGDIYIGRVRNVMPSIQAAFVNIGQKQDAFLHFSDVGETFSDLLKMVGEDPKEAEIDVHLPRVHRSIRTSKDYDSSPSRKSTGRNGDKNDQKGTKGDFVHPARYLRNGEKILVQIVKEPISSKGSRITTHVTLAGRFLVLVPFGDYVAVSKKIWSARERKRLQTLGRSILPDGFGLIIRTVAAGKDAKTLHTDLSLLVEKWEKINEKLKANPAPPKLLHQDVSLVSSVIRDLFTDDYDRILIDDQRLFRSIQAYVRAVAPAMLDAIHHHDSEKPIFEAVGVEDALAEAFSERVNLPSGAYLIIEHTEAMHVIDVNSGRAGRGESQEENSLKVDLEAASALAHQLRLRDLGGIIVVDFIDLRDEKNRNKVVNRLKKEFRNDRAVTKVLPMSDFGLIQITRQRLRPSITTDETAREAEQAAFEDLPSRSSRQESSKPLDVDALLNRLDEQLSSVRAEQHATSVSLAVHPFFGAYLTKGFPSRLNRLRFKHRMKIHLEENADLSPAEFDVKTARGGRPEETVERDSKAANQSNNQKAAPRPSGPKAGERTSDPKAGSKPGNGKQSRGDGGGQKGRSSNQRGTQKRSGDGANSSKDRRSPRSSSESGESKAQDGGRSQKGRPRGGRGNRGRSGGGGQRGGRGRSNAPRSETTADEAAS